MSTKLLKPLCWAFLWLFLLEVALEYRASSRGFQTIFFAAQAPGARQGTDSKQQKYGPSPGFPFRGPIVLEEKPQNELRIWIASASQAEDARTDVRKIFPTVLQQKLRSRGIRCEVINASHAGDNVRDNLQLLKTQSNRWQPDIVILYQMSNDLVRVSGQYLKPNHSDGTPPETETAESSKALQPLQHVLEETTVYQLVKSNLTSRITAELPLEQDLPDEAIGDFAAEVEEFVCETKQLDMVPMICTFAMSHTPDNYEQMPLDYRLAMLKSNPHLDPSGWLRAGQTMNDSLVELAREQNVSLIDAREVLDGKPDYFRDAVHFTPAGHELLAETLAGAVTSILNRKALARK